MAVQQIPRQQTYKQQRETTFRNLQTEKPEQRGNSFVLFKKI